MAEVLNTIDGFLWGMPFIIFVLVIGLYYTIRGKFFPITHFGYIMKNTIGTMFGKNKQKQEVAEGRISSFAAVAIAIGGTVGMGNIGGVATAVATGGPGAVFWMILWAFFGMMIKMVEVTLGCYYRNIDDDGAYYGGSTFMIEKGIDWDRGKHYGVVLAMGFSIALFISWLAGSQAYTISEALNVSFGINPIAFVLVYSVFIFYVTYKGTTRIGNFASKIVPFMCFAFIVGGVLMIIVNYKSIPWVIYHIFRDAFTGTAAAGGFAGAGVSVVIRSGIARSMNSNEAGQGTSPFVHGSADVDHPMKQGLWGAFEVFIDTIIVCNITAWAVLCTGEWNKGMAGATLTIAAYKATFGEAGVIFIGIMCILFGVTTTSAWYSYDIVNIRYMLRNHPVARDGLVKAWKFLFPLPNIIIVTTLTLHNYDATVFWAITDISLVLPIFFNLFSLFVMRNKFFEIFNDYKARYMGIGTVNPDFKVFYEDEPGVMEREKAINVKHQEEIAEHKHHSDK
ncbi:MAG: amino acid carrier protein [Eubacteriales bacterium]|nr:amino acid carrier protein [Eubacteriales bacterium]